MEIVTTVYYVFSKETKEKLEELGFKQTLNDGQYVNSDYTVWIHIFENCEFRLSLSISNRIGNSEKFYEQLQSSLELIKKVQPILENEKKSWNNEKEKEIKENE